MNEISTDYLIIGAGASAMAFTDSLLAETSANVVMVERRDKCGGHWNDAYPFVTLHQPSSFYGVQSRELGNQKIDASGPNKGFEELATGPEVVSYFHSVMRERFLASGRVTFLSSSEYLGDSVVRNLFSGETTQVNARRVVDTSHFQTQIPLTHKRGFTVSGGVSCIPPNALVQQATNHRHFTIIGGGKTAMDTIIWLLGCGAPPDHIRWIVPRASWLLNRKFTQPGIGFFDYNIGGVALQNEILAQSETVDDVADRLLAADIWMCLDSNERPEIVHGATIAPTEVSQLQKITDIVRMGRMTAITPGEIVMEGGTLTTPENSLYIDCTASALSKTKPKPIFSDRGICLQMVRIYQPTFSASLVAKIEAMDLDDDQKNRLARPVAMTDTVRDWIEAQLVSTMNQVAWVGDPEIREWLSKSRLDGFRRSVAEADRNDPTVAATFGRLQASTEPALRNIQKLLSA